MSAERFLQYVDAPQVLSEPDGVSVVDNIPVPNRSRCVEWVGKSTTFWMTEDRRPTTPRRAAWVLFRTKNLGRRYLYNQCGNDKCVNPWHHSFNRS